MPSESARALRDDLGELQARLAVRTAELDQVQKTLADQEEALQELAARRAMRASAVARYRRDLILSGCLLAGTVLLVVAQAHGWLALLSAVPFLLLSGVLLLRRFHAQRHVVAGVGAQPSRGRSIGDDANQRGSDETVDSRQRLIRLATYQHGLSHAQSAVRQLVVAAAHENGGRLESRVECREICRAMWGLELEIGEISTAVEQLIEAGQLFDDGAYLGLTRRSRDEVAKRVRGSSEVEATAFSEWETVVRDMTPSLSHQQMMQLHEDLAAWIQRVIVEHGAEAGLLLYPESERFKPRLDAITNFGFEFLPVRDRETMRERPSALRTFLDRPTSSQRRYFGNLIATSTFVSGITLERSTGAKLHELLKGQRLYLDTNVVYSLLKLSGSKGYTEARRIVDLSRGLGYQVCVTPWTVTEMEESVRLARMRLGRRRRAPRSLVGLLPDSEGDIFKMAFGRMERETGLSLEDFFALYEQVERLLGDEHVEVVDEGCQGIDAVEDRLDQRIAALERVREGPERPRSVQEHDMKHQLLVQMLRGTERRSFSNAGYLMLSNDRALCRFANVDRDNARELPFAVSVERWAQIVRTLTPRTQDYDMTMTSVLDTPSLRQVEVSYADVSEALARIEACETYSERAGACELVDAALGVAGELVCD